MFLRQITDAFLVRTEPDSSIVKPAHIHITSAPQIRNAKLLRTNWVSPSGAARASDTERTSRTAAAKPRAKARRAPEAERASVWGVISGLFPFGCSTRRHSTQIETLPR